MITLSFSKLPTADVVSFNVYRSIVGFVGTLNPSAAGLTLQLAFGGGPTQSITLTADIIGSINAIIVGNGGRAYPSANLAKFLVRADDRTVTGSVQIVGGTALSALGLVTETIIQKSDVVLLGNVAVPTNPNDPVSFNDPDGTLDDFYAVSTIDSFAVESSLSALAQPASPVGPLCTIQGQVTDLQGAPFADATITATLVLRPKNTSATSYVNMEPVSTLTQPDGTFQITVFQGAIIRLQIPEIDYDQNVAVPMKTFALLSELQIDTHYRYPTEFLG